MKGDEMIRVTYLKGKKTSRPKAFTTNPFLQILFLSVLFVISARFNPQFSAYSIRLATGIAAMLALPAVMYHFTKALKVFLATRNDRITENVSMADFVKSHPCPENF